jgi:hypothetical protein
MLPITREPIPGADMSIFGTSLERVLDLQEALGIDLPVPELAHFIIEYVRATALNTEGIFRRSGLKEDTVMLKVC